jgi:hypothetical protein
MDSGLNFNDGIDVTLAAPFVGTRKQQLDHVVPQFAKAKSGVHTWVLGGLILAILSGTLVTVLASEHHQ